MKTRTYFGVVVIAAVIAVIVWATTRPAETLVVVAPITGQLRAFVEEQAVTELPHDYLISMPIGGWLHPIRLAEGDVVKRGEVVARLETDDLDDRVTQVKQHIAVLESRIEETLDHRLEENALIETRATVKAIDETVLAAEAKLEAARALLEFTESELQRIQGLSETASVADRELREAELDFRRAQAEYQSDRLELAALKTIAAVSYIGPKFITDYIDRKSFKLDQLRKEFVETQAQLQIEVRNLERAEIRSPVDGVVLTRHQTQRQFLPAGTPLLTVGRLDEMEVVAEILTERATQISQRDRVEIFGQALGDALIEGRVARVYPAGFRKISALGVEQQRVNVAIAPDERPEALGVGFRVYVRIYHDEVDDALIVPRTSLFRGNDGGWRVIVVQGGRVEYRRVKVGLLNDDRAQILEGLSTEDRVVPRPSRQLEPGLRVRIERR